ncbi:predicted protein [Streptomyces sp. C]|nr:predicted protein [Streptomyces sp. C]
MKTGAPPRARHTPAVGWPAARHATPPGTSARADYLPLDPQGPGGSCPPAPLSAGRDVGERCSPGAVSEPVGGFPSVPSSFRFGPVPQGRSFVASLRDRLRRPLTDRPEPESRKTAGKPPKKRDGRCERDGSLSDETRGRGWPAGHPTPQESRSGACARLPAREGDQSDLRSSQTRQIATRSSNLSVRRPPWADTRTKRRSEQPRMPGGRVRSLRAPLISAARRRLGTVMSPQKTRSHPLPIYGGLGWGRMVVCRSLRVKKTPADSDKPPKILREDRTRRSSKPFIRPFRGPSSPGRPSAAEIRGARSDLLRLGASRAALFDLWVRVSAQGGRRAPRREERVAICRAWVVGGGL